jgi:hypothetical protein
MVLNSTFSLVVKRTLEWCLSGERLLLRDTCLFVEIETTFISADREKKKNTLIKFSPPKTSKSSTRPEVQL